MAGKAINQLLDESVKERLGVLSCASSTPDQMLPSHAAMTHCVLGSKPLEIYSQQKVCLTASQTLKAAYMSVKYQETEEAIYNASKLVSPTFLHGTMTRNMKNAMMWEQISIWLLKRIA